MTPASSRLLPAALVALFAAVAFVGVALWRLSNDLRDRGQVDAQNAATLQLVLGEVTRLRIEQSSGTQGPQALLTKLRTFAPLIASSRTTEPDFKNAQKEMDAILRALQTLGTDAWKPISERLATLKPEKDFDEIKWLLEAGVRIDHEAGLLVLKEVLLGRRLPTPRLRWFAADCLTRHDRPLAQTLLRQVLMTESSRGFNPDRASAYPGAVIPDPAAMSNTGFNNYVVAYLRTEDPKVDDTLLMVIGRTEHDAVTIQECVKALGEHRCAAASEAIEKLYWHPPLQQENPIFLNYCLDALVEIRGKAARAFLEAALAKVTTEAVQRRIEFLLNKIK